MSFDIDPDYVDVAERLREFRARYPDGTVQQESLQFIDFAGKSWVVYTASAYRTPDDPRPGQGTAWEPVPGKTPFTRDSELQNAETAAWGRAVVAVGAADAKRIASVNEIRNREADRNAPPEPTGPSPMEAKAQEVADRLGLESDLEKAQSVQAWVFTNEMQDILVQDSAGDRLPLGSLCARIVTKLEADGRRPAA